VENAALQNIERWRQRYYESLAALENKERQWAKLESLLRRSISRLTLLAAGINPGLDHQREKLRSIIRDERDDARIKALQDLLSGMPNHMAYEGTRRPGIYPLETLSIALDHGPMGPGSFQAYKRYLRAQGRRQGTKYYWAVNSGPRISPHDTVAKSLSRCCRRQPSKQRCRSWKSFVL